MEITAQQLHDILQNIYRKGNETKDITTIDIINEMKENILSAHTSKLEK